MPLTRRHFIRKLAVATLALAASALRMPTALAFWKVEEFAPGTLDATLAKLVPQQAITDSDQITLTIPQIAENGAVVPVSVSTTLAEVKSISLLVEKNPVPLAIRFELSPEVDATVSARIKMAETANVIALVETANGFFRTKAQVKVTIGGCGG